MRVRRRSASTRPSTATASAGPSPAQSLPVNEKSANESCSKPSQPSRARRWTRLASSQAWPGWTSTYGLVARKAATASPAEAASLRHFPHPATTSGTSRNTPGYFALAARPAATPAHSSRPVTASASETAISAVIGTSVTAVCE